MDWIKRNLFFVVGGGVALVLLGVAAYYIYQGWSRNSQASAKLNEIYATLQHLAQEKPAPGNKSINNNSIAREQEQQAAAWIAGARQSFRPVPAIPPDASVTSEAYASALRRTIDQLQHDAESASVKLPPKYDFSFTKQLSLVEFAAGSLNGLAAQLGEVRALAEILFAARINALDSVQRVRVSADDLTGPQSDYLDSHPTTNDLAIVMPYVVTFRSFTPELARVLVGFATSSNAFVVKAVNVQPAGAETSGPGDLLSAQPGLASGMSPQEFFNRRFMPGYLPPAAMPPATPAPAPGRGGLPVVLKEHLLRITLEVELVKLRAKS